MTYLRRMLQFLEDPSRMAIAAVVSLEVARLCRLPESYWAPITTIVIMQSTWVASLSMSVQRIAGTAMGAVSGALIATYFRANWLTFGIGILAVGLICALLRMDKPAVRFARITIAIVMLIPHNVSYWTAGFRRFFEVSVGIVVGLAVAAAWPDPSEDAAAPAAQQRA